MEDRLKSLSVLVVDDDRLMRKLVSDVLVKLGFSRIFKAIHGGAALSILDSTPIDFIITDWRMENMDGIEFIRHVRTSMKEYALIPIIMLTGNAEAHQVLQARDVGVNEYLIKPFTVKDLCSRLKQIIDHPREFVLAPAYIGPSRRRRTLPPVTTTERRQRHDKPMTREMVYDQLERSYS